MATPTTPRQQEIQRRLRVIRELLTSALEMAGEAEREYSEQKHVDFLASLACISGECGVVTNRIRDIQNEAYGK